MKKKLWLTILPLALCAALLLPSAALAADTDADTASSPEIPEELVSAVAAEIADEVNLTHAPSSVYDGYITRSVGTNDLPSSFDLRDRGVVTPVKLQYPFGTCWAFGAIAASEISLLSKLDMTCEEFEEEYGYAMDLSERQVAYFVHNAIPESESTEYDDQGGEGTHYINDDLNREMSGGLIAQVGDIFSDGTGPVFEQEVPYQGQDGSYINATTSRGSEVLCYDPEDDWSVPEEYRSARDFDLISCTELICPAVLDEDGNYSYDPYGTYDIKCALYEGYGVEIAFCADNSMPGKPTTTAYMNTSGENPTWAHYTYDAVSANHAVCIVGWDDDYPASNFTEGHQPPANGAWIVKNSWGSVDSDEMNTCDWGYEGSGYFYLSYYDKSLENPTIFDFDVSRFTGESTEETVLKQYDYTVTDVACSVPFTDEVASANVYTAEKSTSLQSISVCTRDYDSSIVYMIYLLNDDSSDPQDGTLITSRSVEIEHAGTHTIALESPVALTAGDRVAIVVKNVTTADDGSLGYTLRVNAMFNQEGMLALTNPTNSESYNAISYQKAVIHPGESYVLYDGVWYDWSDVADAVNASGGDAQYVDIDNFTIKGIFTA